jgi:SSS family solute:Na+ symporter
MSVLLVFLGVITALISDSIGTVFRLVIAIGTGPGVVLVLRWFWWRINAAAELAAMLCGFGIGLSTSVVPVLQIADYGLRLIITTTLTAVVWLVVMLSTPPESAAVLERFVQQVQPPGPGWRRWRQPESSATAESLPALVLRFLLSSAVLFGALLGSGAFLLHQQLSGWLGLMVTVISLTLLLRTGRRRRLMV